MTENEKLQQYLVELKGQEQTLAAAAQATRDAIRQTEEVLKNLSSSPKPTTMPATIMLHDPTLRANKKKIQEKSAPHLKALKVIRYKGDEALKTKDRDIVSGKRRTPPSGNRNDYESKPPYWWPDPETKNGLPYIQKDGIINSDLQDDYPDNIPLRAMCDQVEDLGLAYYFTGDQKYAEAAIRKMSVFFLNPKTRMNPNLNFAQGVPGRSQGRIEGIIDGQAFLQIFDSFLFVLPVADEAFEKGMIKWFSDFATWLTTSPLGKEAREKGVGNIRNCYCILVTATLTLAGRSNEARDFVNKDLKALIAEQIDDKGTLPQETKRTKSWMYSCKALILLYQAAQVAENAGVPVWDYAPGGAGLMKAARFLLTYAMGKAKWPYKNIEGAIKISYMDDYMLPASSVYGTTPGWDGLLTAYLDKYAAGFYSGGDGKLLHVRARLL